MRIHKAILNVIIFFRYRNRHLVHESTIRMSSRLSFERGVIIITCFVQTNRLKDFITFTSYKRLKTKDKYISLNREFLPSPATPPSKSQLSHDVYLYYKWTKCLPLTLRC